MRAERTRSATLSPFPRVAPHTGPSGDGALAGTAATNAAILYGSAARIGR
jgi:hypothetical protein